MQSILLPGVAVLNCLVQQGPDKYLVSQCTELSKDILETGDNPSSHHELVVVLDRLKYLQSLSRLTQNTTCRHYEVRVEI